jgi:hypothetical protein
MLILLFSYCSQKKIGGIDMSSIFVSPHTNFCVFKFPN